MNEAWPLVGRIFVTLSEDEACVVEFFRGGEFDVAVTIAHAADLAESSAARSKAEAGKVISRVSIKIGSTAEAAWAERF